MFHTSARLAFLLLLAVIGCERRPPGSLATEYQVSVSGCKEIRPGPRCFLNSGEQSELTLWVEPANDSRLDIAIDDIKIASTSNAMDSGIRIQVKVPAGAKQLELQTSDNTPIYTLFFEPSPVCPQIDEARRIFKHGKPDEALALLNSPAYNRPCLAMRLGARGRIFLATGKPEDAAKVLKEAMEVDKKDHNLLGQVKNALTLAWIRTFRKPSYSEARKLLEQIRPVAQRLPESEASWSYYRGQLARESGDLRTAMELYSKSERWARRLLLQKLLLATIQAKADCLQVLGRENEADRLLQKLLNSNKTEFGPCDQAALYTNLGWLRLQWHQDGLNAKQSLLHALKLYRGKCSSREDEANTLINLSLAAWQVHKVGDARKLLDEAKSLLANPGPLLQSWIYDLEGRLELDSKKPKKALKIYKKMIQGTPPISFDRWRATVGLAYSLQEIGRLNESLAQYAQAENLLDQQLRLIPISAGRTTFLAERLQGTSRYIELLLEKGETKKAMNTARRSRARVLWALAGGRMGGKAWGTGGIEEFHLLMNRLQDLQRKIDIAASDDLPVLLSMHKRLGREARGALDHAWATALPQLPGRDFSGKTKGVVFLVYHPLPDGWVGFASMDGQVQAQGIQLPKNEDADKQAWSLALVEPFRSKIVLARRIAVLPFGKLQAMDFHALPLGGRPMLSIAPLVYPLDIPATNSSASTPSSSRVALQVVDPSGNLPEARKAAQTMAKGLENRGWKVKRLTGPSANRQSILDGFAHVGLLHFAGHAQFIGREGWDSQLVLLHPPGIGVSDILACERVPEIVVLAACQSGQLDDTTGVSGLGLAQAFVLAGAKDVVAASREINDGVAARLFVDFYGAQASGDPALALQKAQLKMIASCPSCDWSALRILVP